MLIDLDNGEININDNGYKKIYISPSNQNFNLYATGGTNEREQCHKIARACYNYLKSKGLVKRVTYRSWKDDEADNAYFYLSQIINSTDKPLDQSSKTVTNLFDQEVLISKKISHNFHKFHKCPPLC